MRAGIYESSLPWAIPGRSVCESGKTERERSGETRFERVYKQAVSVLILFSSSGERTDSMPVAGRCQEILHAALKSRRVRAATVDFIREVDGRPGNFNTFYRQHDPRRKASVHAGRAPQRQVIAAMMASANSAVFASPPMSRVRTLPSSKTLSIARSTRSAASRSPRFRSIRMPDCRSAVGLAMP